MNNKPVICVTSKGEIYSPEDLITELDERVMDEISKDQFDLNTHPLDGLIDILYSTQVNLN